MQNDSTKSIQLKRMSLQKHILHSAQLCHSASHTTCHAENSLNLIPSTDVETYQINTVVNVIMNCSVALFTLLTKQKTILRLLSVSKM